MKIFKKKKFLLVAAIVLVLLIGTYLKLKNNVLVFKSTVKILEYGSSVCTMDVPSSWCGPYEVTAQSNNGEKLKYKVEGFDNGKSERYDDITSHITKAKEQNTAVTLKTDNKGFIIAVE